MTDTFEGRLDKEYTKSNHALVDKAGSRRNEAFGSSTQAALWMCGNKHSWLTNWRFVSQQDQPMDPTFYIQFYIHKIKDRSIEINKPSCFRLSALVGPIPKAPEAFKGHLSLHMYAGMSKKNSQRIINRKGSDVCAPRSFCSMYQRGGDPASTLYAAGKSHWLPSASKLGNRISTIDLHKQKKKVSLHPF